MATLEGLAAAMRDLSKVPSQAARAAAADIAGLIEQQYADGTDPYGDAWADLAESTIAKGRTPPPLTDSGVMRAGTDVAPSAGAGITITLGADYAIYHQGGTGSMPARPILPDHDLPEAWRDMIANAVAEAVARRLARAA
jgi:hypothetical protein